VLNNVAVATLYFLCGFICCCLLVEAAQTETSLSLSVPQKQILFGAVSHSNNIKVEPVSR